MQRVTDWPLRAQSVTRCGRDRRVAGSPGRGRQEQPADMHRSTRDRLPVRVNPRHDVGDDDDARA
jgi:hypothetical protein